MQLCTKKQPKGAHCTLEEGHSGPCIPKQSKWSRFVNAVGNAIGQAKFGGQ